MVAFDPNDSSERFRIDWRVLQNAWFSAYQQVEELDEDLAELKKLGYTAFDFDCAKWDSEKELRDELYQTLGFPGGFVTDFMNFDAFNDWFWDLELDGRDKVVVFRHLDKLYEMEFAKFSPERFIQILLDIFSDTARGHLLFGSRFIVLLELEDKHSLPKFGEAHVN